MDFPIFTPMILSSSLIKKMDPVTDPLDFNNQEDNIGAQIQTDPILDPLALASADGFVQDK